ncbi:hypothetical protein NCC49_004138 [Naganishia albida]|nr:hypothetical protein NCC49_004138 [Naganishia albida]
MSTPTSPRKTKMKGHHRRSSSLVALALVFCANTTAALPTGAGSTSAIGLAAPNAAAHAFVQDPREVTWKFPEKRQEPSGITSVIPTETASISSEPAPTATTTVVPDTTVVPSTTETSVAPSSTVEPSSSESPTPSETPSSVSPTATPTTSPSSSVELTSTPEPSSSTVEPSSSTESASSSSYVLV